MFLDHHHFKNVQLPRTFHLSHYCFTCWGSHGIWSKESLAEQLERNEHLATTRRLCRPHHPPGCETKRNQPRVPRVVWAFCLAALFQTLTCFAAGRISVFTFKLKVNPILCCEYCGQHPSPPQTLGRENIVVNISHFRKPHLQVVGVGARAWGSQE